MAEKVSESSSTTADALRFVADLQNQARTTTVVKLPEIREGVYLLDGPDGPDMRTAAPPWHNEELATPEELVRFTRRYAQKNSAVFYNELRVVFVRDIDDRRDESSCELRITPQWEFLIQKSKSKLSQAEMVLLLRTVFRDGVSRDFLQLMRSLKFIAGQQTTGRIGQGVESLGREVQAQSEQTMPEEIEMRFPIFENFRVAASVTCALEVFPQEANFRLTPIAQSLQYAMDSVLDGGIRPIFLGDVGPDGDESSDSKKPFLPPVFRGAP